MPIPTAHLRPLGPAADGAPPEAQRRWMESDDAMALWREYERSGDGRLRDRLVLTYAPLVKFIVFRKVGELPATCEVDDLVRRRARPTR